MDNDLSININTNIIWKKIGKRTVILNKNDNTRIILNEVGMIVWDFIARKKSINGAIESIIIKYCISREKAEFDIDIFLHGLEKEKIISIK